MWDFEYVIELAKAYRRAEITRDELQDKIHRCSLKATSLFSRETTATKPRLILWLPQGFLFFTNVSNLGLRLQTSRLLKTMNEEPPGYWYVDKGDDRVKDFPPE